MMKSRKKVVKHIQYTYFTWKIRTWFNCTRSIFKLSQIIPDYKTVFNAIDIGKMIVLSHLGNWFSTKQDPKINFKKCRLREK